MKTGPDYRHRLPLELCGKVMTKITPVMVCSLRMAIEGASVARGHRPQWLDRASDIRFLDYVTDNGDTLLVLGVPPLGEAAEDLYQKQ